MGGTRQNYSSAKGGAVNYDDMGGGSVHGGGSASKNGAGNPFNQTNGSNMGASMATAGGTQNTANLKGKLGALDVRMMTI